MSSCRCIAVFLLSELGAPISFSPWLPKHKQKNQNKKEKPHLASWKRKRPLQPHNFYGVPGPLYLSFPLLILLPQLYIPRWDINHLPYLSFPKEAQDCFCRSLVIEGQGHPGRYRVSPPAAFAHAFSELLDLGPPRPTSSQRVGGGAASRPGRTTSICLTAACTGSSHLTLLVFSSPTAFSSVLYPLFHCSTQPIGHSRNIYAHSFTSDQATHRLGVSQ